MQRDNLPADSDRLFRFAETVARRLAAQHEDLRTDEALLRAAIAWAEFTENSCQAVVERAKKSRKARAFVEPARMRRIRAEYHLRRRLTEVIARKRQIMNDERLLSLAGFVPSIVR